MSLKNTNIILDLDETLVHTFDEKKEFHNQCNINSPDLEWYVINSSDVNSNGDIITSQLYGVKRPHLKEFLNFCFNNFNLVIVWSAGTKRYVRDITNRIFSQNRRPHVVFSKEDCYVDENGITKPIPYLIKNNSYLSKHLNIKNTFILDDREENYYLNKENGILIPAYNSCEKGDKYLLTLKNWFMKIQETKVDVRKINKKNIF